MSHTNNKEVERIKEKLVKHLTDRFLGWHLPKDFHPDGGIMFMDAYDNGTEMGGTHEPIGTNLLTAEQAKEMFRFLLEHEDGTPIIAELLHQELQKAREEERERIKKFLSLRDASPRTDFDSDEEYQLHRQKNGAINWYANLIKGQIDLPDLPETNY